MVNFRLALKDSLANLLLEKINLLGLSGSEWKAVKEDRRCFFKLKPSTTGKVKMKALQNNKDDFFEITKVLSLSYGCLTFSYRTSLWRIVVLRLEYLRFIFDYWQSGIVSDRRTILFLLISGPQRYPESATNQNFLLINCTCGLDLTPRALLKSQEVYKFVSALILPPT